MIKNITKNIVPALAVTAGAVASSFVSKLVPDTLGGANNAKIKAAAPFVLGLILMGSGKGKDKMLGNVAVGLVAGGGKALASSFGLGNIPDPIMDLDEIDIDSGMEGIPNPINGEDLPENEMA